MTLEKKKSVICVANMKENKLNINKNIKKYIK